MKNLFTLKLFKISFLLITILFASSSGAFAQITVDGNPIDWTNFTTNAYFNSNAFAPDVINAAGNTDNQFTQGSKDANAVVQLHWSNGTANAKGDIGNAGAVLVGCQLYFFADRHAVNGDAAIGFWFYKSPVSLNANGTFSGQHSDGDVLIISHFTNGGGTSDIYEYRTTGSAPNSLVFIQKIVGSLPQGQATVNTQTWNVPDPMVYSPKAGAADTYPTGSFFEGRVDLCLLLGAATPPCFSSFLAETRNSQSITASLQDFAIGGFTTNVGRPAVTVTEPTLCGSSTACVSIVGSLAGSYTMSQPENLNYGTNGSRTIQVANNGDVVEFCDLVPGGKFSVYYSTSNGCSSEPTTCDNYLANTRQTAPVTKPIIGKAESKDLSAYPVPFSETVTVEFKASKAEKFVINLYNLQGQLVKQLLAGNSKAGEVIKVEVSGSGMAESMYLVRKESKSGTSTVKLLKKD